LTIKILDNQEYLQVFENDEYVVNFLTDDDPITEVYLEEDQNLHEEVHEKIHKFLQRNKSIWNPSSQEMTKSKFQNQWKILLIETSKKHKR
jgi:hypothetical protein